MLLKNTTITLFLHIYTLLQYSHFQIFINTLLKTDTMKSTTSPMRHDRKDDHKNDKINRYTN